MPGLGFPLARPLTGSNTPPALPLDYVPSWYQRLVGKLYEQFKGKPNIDLFLQMLGAQFQDLEDAFQSLFTIASIDLSTGINLDVIGRRVGQARAGLADSVYRLYLRARIAANLSDGTPEDIYRVFEALLAGKASIKYSRSGIANETFQIVSPPLDPLTAIAAGGFLGDAKVAGVGGGLLWQPALDGDVFMFGTASIPTGGQNGYSSASTTVIGGVTAFSYMTGGQLAGIIAAP